MSQGSLITEVIHPFGRAFGTTSLLSTGVQYGSAVSTPNATTTQLSTTYQSVEEVTISLPENALLKEVEIGLTTEIYVNPSTASATLQGRIKDVGQTSYDTILAAVSTLSGHATPSTSHNDYTFSRRTTPSDGTYFTGKGSFNMDFQIKCSVTTSAAAAAPKSSSYLAYTYWLLG